MRSLYERFYDLYQLETTIETYDGVESADCYVAYGPNNIFYLTADVTLKKNVKKEDVDIETLKEFVKKELSEDQVPSIINFVEWRS